nr:hypothetical protein [uncultured Methanobrevibacter sp.]
MRQLSLIIIFRISLRSSANTHASMQKRMRCLKKSARPDISLRITLISLIQLIIFPKSVLTIMTSLSKKLKGKIPKSMMSMMSTQSHGIMQGIFKS